MNFIENLDQDKPDHLEILKKKNIDKVRASVNNESELNEVERDLLIK